MTKAYTEPPTRPTRGETAVNIVEPDSGIAIEKPWDNAFGTLVMSLDKIERPEDLQLWAEHNRLVALFIADLVRNEVFAEGTDVRRAYLDSKTVVIPKPIREAMRVHDAVTIRPKETSFGRLKSLFKGLMATKEQDISLNLPPEPADESAKLGITWVEESGRERILKKLASNQEINSDVIFWLADYLGVPMLTYVTAGVQNGQGGHAEAIIRTPYLDGGKWKIDLLDPMSLKPTIGVVIPGRNKDEAYYNLFAGDDAHAYSNAIGLHFVEHQIDYDLFGHIHGSKGQFLEMLRNISVAQLQDRDSINCQLMSLLIQSYLWVYYGSVNEKQDANGLTGIELGNIISRRFHRMFGITIKNSFDVMSQVKLDEVPQGFQIQKPALHRDDDVIVID